jgi:flagellar basal body-associated protein FliL
MAEEEAEEGGEEAAEEKKGLPIKLILIVVGVLALGGGGYFAYTNYN